jgi:hypothetical protein
MGPLAETVDIEIVYSWIVLDRVKLVMQSQGKAARVGRLSGLLGV